MSDDKQRGSYRKYNVERVDGKPVKDCFVLELKDPIARKGLQAWAEALIAADYINLALDVAFLIDEYEKKEEQKQ